MPAQEPRQNLALLLCNSSGIGSDNGQKGFAACVDAKRIVAGKSPLIRMRFQADDVGKMEQRIRGNTTLILSVNPDVLALECAFLAEVMPQLFHQ